MFDWGLEFLDGLVNFVSDPGGAIAGWTFDKVAGGIYEWLARGLALLIEWVWAMLDAGTTPRLTEDWFANDLARRVGALGLAVTVAMMLASAIQAAVAGRPEQVLDAVREAAKGIVASALTVTAVDMAVQVVDEASATVWRSGRGDLVAAIEAAVTVATAHPLLGATFVGPLCLLFGFVGLVGLAVSLLMRSSLIYLVAAFAPLVWSAAVLPVMRDASRRLVHLLVALVVSKLAIVITLVVSVNLLTDTAGPTAGGADMDTAAAVGTLLTSFTCYLVAAISPFVVYRLMPTVEGAAMSSGIAGGWGRGALSLGQGATTAMSLTAATAATRAVAGQADAGTDHGATASAAPPTASTGGSRGERTASSPPPVGQARGRQPTPAAGGAAPSGRAGASGGPRPDGPAPDGAQEPEPPTPPIQGSGPAPGRHPADSASAAPPSAGEDEEKDG